MALVVARILSPPAVRRLRLVGRLLRRAMLWLLMLCLLCFFLFPFYWLTITSLKPPDEVEAYPVQWLPSHLYLGSFRAAFSYLNLQIYLANSVIVALTTTIIALALSIGAGYALARLPLPAKRVLLTLVVLAVSITGIVLVPTLYLLLRDVGWLNTRRALIAPYVATSLPFAIWLLTNAFREVPGALTQQAEVDGCTHLQVLWRLVLPLSSPAIFTVAVVIFLGAWNEYLFASMFILDVHSSIETAPMAVAKAGGNWGLVSAASEITMLPIIALVLIFQNRIIQGLTAGALKG